MAHTRKRENSLTFWDRSGFPILNIVSEKEDLTSVDLLSLDDEVREFLGESGIKVDNSSEEYVETKMKL